jgi:bacteriorhodopsin
LLTFFKRYTIACIAYVWILYTLLVTGRRSAGARGASVSKFFTAIAGYTLILWTAYPVVWAIADGTRRVSVNTEIIVYGVLDVLAKGVFGAWLLFTHKRQPESHANVSGFWAHGLNSEGRIRVGDDDEDGA